MPTIYINTKNDYQSKNDSSNCEYYSNLISSEIKNALNSNAINLANNKIERAISEEMPDFSNINLQIDSENNDSSDYIISISYKSGNPQSQRLKNILEINLKNIIPESTNIKTTEAEENDFEEDIIIKINCSNEENFRWLRNNIENYSLHGSYLRQSDKGRQHIQTSKYKIGNCPNFNRGRKNKSSVTVGRLVCR